MHDGVTALALLETTVAAGSRVLVVGASGGLGIKLIQLAVARGAHVVVMARGAGQSSGRLRGAGSRPR